MNKSLLYRFLLIVTLIGMSNVSGMTTTQRVSKIKLRPPVNPPKTVLYTKTYQPLSWGDRFKQSWNRFKELMFGPRRIYNEIPKEVNVILEKIKNNEQIPETLKTFIKEHDQEEVDILLDNLIISGGLAEFNECVFWLFDDNTIIRKKITHWTKKNIVNLFILDIPTDDKEFFLFTLLRRFHNRKLIQSIKDNFVAINQKISGKRFIDSIRTRDIDLYNTIVPDNEKILSEIRKSSAMVNRE